LTAEHDLHPAYTRPLTPPRRWLSSGWPWAIAALAILAGTIVAGTVATPAQGLPQFPVAPIAGPQAAAPAAPAPADARPEWEAPVIARCGDLELVSPSRALTLVSFHEASRPQALELVPVGRMAINDNPYKFHPTADVEDGLPYVVQVSRGRSNPATSSIDLAMPEDKRLRAIVSGTVLDVRPFTLYGRYEDVRVEIAPEGHPDLVVVLIHLEGVRVRPGDVVVAGETPIADGARLFPFFSQVEEHLDEHAPHAHVECKPAGSPRPGAQ